MSKNLIVCAKLYTIIWQYDDAHGNYRERHRILSCGAEDAIEQTRPHKNVNAKLVRLEVLSENVEIAVTKELWKAAWTDGNLPYHDADVRALLEAEYCET